VLPVRWVEHRLADRNDEESSRSGPKMSADVRFRPAVGRPSVVSSGSGPFTIADSRGLAIVADVLLPSRAVADREACHQVSHGQSISAKTTGIAGSRPNPYRCFVCSGAARRRGSSRKVGKPIKPRTMCRRAISARADVQPADVVSTANRRKDVLRSPGRYRIVRVAPIGPDRGWRRQKCM